MTLLQTPQPAPINAPASIEPPARVVRLRFHDGSTKPPTAPNAPVDATSPARRRLWSLGASEAALDLALDRMIDQAARELRDGR